MESSIPDHSRPFFQLIAGFSFLEPSQRPSDQPEAEAEASSSKRKIQSGRIKGEARSARSFHGVHSGSPFTVDCWLFMVLEPAKALPFSRRLKRKKKGRHLEEEARNSKQNSKRKRVRRVMVKSIRLSSSMT
jgi:hypothetical protein